MTTDIHARYTVRQTTDKGEIAAFLNRDRLYAGYALCDLEDEYFASCQWFLTLDDRGEARGLAMVFGRLDPEVLFVMGEPNAVRTTLENDLTPPYIQLTARTEHLSRL